MALTRLTIDGYGQIELNQVAFRRDGRIEAQCKINSTITTSPGYVENGMLLAVDKANGTVGYPASNAGLIGLNYTTEHMYDERDVFALKKFKLDAGTFFPRLGYLATGDRFTTNCIAYDTTAYATEAALKTALAGAATTAVYGQPCANGAIQIVASKPTGAVVLQVVKATTMPDGQYAVKFVVL